MGYGFLCESTVYYMIDFSREGSMSVEQGSGNSFCYQKRGERSHW